ncbi:uncharacterized protein LOC5517116 isoform X2 [Nematostella vectensis]|uniref:uncharacterized protein LOC5517116 isoform X2 n=1 Tax=Nematostella vectensis TaxID=45351 RepID=UPI002076E81D|nr:uncharacterized protein LOC5517116 isoform X2 [Nematostella vectensis]
MTQWERKDNNPGTQSSTILRLLLHHHRRQAPPAQTDQWVFPGLKDPTALKDLLDPPDFQALKEFPAIPVHQQDPLDVMAQWDPPDRQEGKDPLVTWDLWDQWGWEEVLAHITLAGDDKNGTECWKWIE